MYRGASIKKPKTFFCKKCEMQFRGRIIFGENAVCPCCKENREVEVYIELLEKEERKTLYPTCNTCGIPGPGRMKKADYWECVDCLHRELDNQKPPPGVMAVFSPPPNLSAAKKYFTIDKKLLFKSELASSGWGVE